MRPAFSVIRILFSFTDKDISFFYESVSIGTWFHKSERYIVNSNLILNNNKLCTPKPSDTTSKRETETERPLEVWEPASLPYVVGFQVHERPYLK